MTAEVGSDPVKVIVGSPLIKVLDTINAVGGAIAVKVVTAIIVSMLIIVIMLQYNNNAVLNAMPSFIQSIILKLGPVSFIWLGFLLGGLVTRKSSTTGSYEGGSGFQHPYYTTGAHDPKGMSDNHLPQY